MRLTHKRKQKTWPNGPRFVVGSVTGLKIDPQSGGRNRYPASQPMPTLWYVNDAAFCYATLFETWSEHEARLLAMKLNGEAIPMPHVERACKLCAPTDEQILAGQVVVSPRGYGRGPGDRKAHLPKAGSTEGWTECGKDATAEGWWWPQ